MEQNTCNVGDALLNVGVKLPHHAGPSHCAAAHFPRLYHLPNSLIQIFLEWSPNYKNPIPTRFLAPLDCLKIPALFSLIVIYVKKRNQMASKIATEQE